MHEKKRQEKKQPLPELRTSVTEILVANGRSFQPFIRTFSYTGENVSKATLGTLLGVFEIDDQSEDSAYIVNFLASVAKKEYWSNPRRGAIESFEAALHKINLALAELVKHGNVSWLGKLHGAIGILEKNNLHFSVTGKAKILLRRNDILSDISLGLASEESQAHPIKTFIEVSSGRLSATDQAFLASPELLALFSLDDLSKHATRMDHEHFTRFLRTALVNELDMAGLMTVDVIEGEVPVTPDRKKRSTEEYPTEARNAFSQSSYAPPQTSEVSPLPTDPQNGETKTVVESEYVDTKTGHIYVQGDTPQVSDEHPLLEALRMKLQEFPHVVRNAVLSQAKVWRRAKKQVGFLIHAGKEGGGVLGRKFSRFLRRYRRKLASTLEQKEATPDTISLPREIISPPLVTDIPTPVKPTLDAKSAAMTIKENTVVMSDRPADMTEQEWELPLLVKEKLSLFYQRKEVSHTEAAAPAPKNALSGARQSATSTLANVTGATANVAKRSVQFWQKLSLIKELQSFLAAIVSKIQSLFRSLPTPTKRQILIAAALIIGGLMLSFFLFSSIGKVPQAPLESNEPAITTATTLATESSGEMVTLLTVDTEKLITSVILNDLVYGITSRNIVASADGTTFSLPGEEVALFATAMDDLRLIFIYTESGKLLAWSPIAKTFVESALALPDNADVIAIDTYLTYLYVLDNVNNQVHRFPRAEGGFGDRLAWFKESVVINDDAHLAVNETLFLSPNPSTINGFFRGRSTSNFDVPEGGLSVTDLYTRPGLQHVYALDAENHQIIVWNQAGQIIKRLTHEKFAEGKTLTVNEKTTEIFISTENALLSYTMP